MRPVCQKCKSTNVLVLFTSLYCNDCANKPHGPKFGTFREMLPVLERGGKIAVCDENGTSFWPPAIYIQLDKKNPQYVDWSRTPSCLYPQMTVEKCIELMETAVDPPQLLWVEVTG